MSSLPVVLADPAGVLQFPGVIIRQQVLDTSVTFTGNPAGSFGQFYLTGLDLVALNAAGTPVIMNAQADGVFFWSDTQNIGAGEQIYASWRGLVPVDSVLQVLMQASIGGTTLSCVASGVYSSWVP